ncbi:MAG: hypothetical protein WCP34_15155 [Pseudomonadota bacterium]
MSLSHLPEHVENALLALDLAQREAAHLAYTHRTLFAQPIDLPWEHATRLLMEVVANLAQQALTLGLREAPCD